MRRYDFKEGGNSYLPEHPEGRFVLYTGIERQLQQARREGWEQCHKETMNKVYAEGSVSCNYCSDIADAIAAMGYGEKKENLKNWCDIEGVAP